MSIESGSNCPASNTDVQKNIQSLSQLKEWLTARGIDISEWGQGTAKSVERLWDEIVSQEVRLQDNPPLRLIEVVQITICNGTGILIEAEQVFEDNRKRSRNHPPSEKIKQSESYIEAAIRCLQEELGLERQNFEIIPSTHQQHQTLLESPSYPGLNTRYTVHMVEAKVRGLPETDFWTNETTANQTDPVKRHYWIWQTIDPPC